MLFQNSSNKFKLRSINLKLKKSLINGSVKNNYRYREHSVYIPHMLNVLILSNNSQRSTVFHMTNKTYYANLGFKNTYGFVSFDTYTNVISFKSIYSQCFYLLFFRTFESALTAFLKPTFIKLKFKGKGYYIYKNYRNTIAPQFGYSHRVYIYSYFCAVKFLGKTKVLLFGFSKNDLLASALLVKEKRSINIFTGRGVRFSKQVIYKKQGKVSSYR